MAPLRSLACLLLAGAASALDWKSCGDGLVVPTDAKLVPEPAVSGKRFDVTVQANAVSEIPNGNIALTIKYIGTTIYEVPLDFCKTAACPVPAGPFPISYGYVLPSVSPPGAYSIELKAKTGAGADLFCFDANFHVNFWAENGDVALPVPKGADDAEAWSNIQTVFRKAAEAQ